VPFMNTAAAPPPPSPPLKHCSDEWKAAVPDGTWEAEWPVEQKPTMPNQFRDTRRTRCGERKEHSKRPIQKQTRCDPVWVHNDPEVIKQQTVGNCQWLGDCQNSANSAG
jgi:hypothetical protein